jgi:GABA permease
MSSVLVIANETLGGQPLIDAMRQRAAGESEVNFFVVVPESRPRHGNVIYTEVVHDAAQLRLDLALARMRDEDIQGDGEVGDSDPYNAAMDAIATHKFDEIILSTLPAASSGWMRRDFVERLKEGSGLPVQHVVFDLDSEGYRFDFTLVVANLTVAGPELVKHLKEKAKGKRPRRFIVIVPQDSGDGHEVEAARTRLATLLQTLAAEGLIAAGTIGDPDPYVAVMNELSFFPIQDIVVSTLPEADSRWMKLKVVDRLRSSSRKPVEHVISSSTQATAAGR